MRVSSNTFPTSLIEQLKTLNNRQVELQKQVATGQRLDQPSDDPAAMARLRQMQAQQREAVTFRRNFDRAETTLEFASNSTQLLNQLSRLALNTVGLLTGADSQEEMNRAADQIDDVLEQAVAIGNEKFNNQYIFSGETVAVEPFATTVTDGSISAVTYQGGTGEMEYFVGGTTRLNPTTTGTQNQEFADWMNEMISLRDALRAGDRPAISTSAAALEGHDDNILVTVSDLGSKAVRLEFIQQAENSRFDALETEISKEADVDLARAITQLNLTQTAYQAALQSAGQILNLSLLDYV